MVRLITVLGLAVVWVVVQGGPLIEAQSATANLQVSASVKKNCTISTTPVSFGSYDPITANKSSNLDADGSVIVTCTKGASAKVGLDAGKNNQGTARRMSGSTTGFLNYELYKDTGRSQVWGNDDATDLDVPAAQNSNPQTFQVHGRVPNGQDASVGDYNDVVVATVNF